MPVTARLSKKFYDRFGDDIAGEFVDWFNAVDSTYQQQLREQNDLNWERFKSELHSAIAQSEGRTRDKLSQFDLRLNQLELRMAEKFSELMKWMFIYWSGTILSIAGVLLAVLRK